MKIPKTAALSLLLALAACTTPMLDPGAGARLVSVDHYVHGAGTPAEVSFDVFSMDMTGYGLSTRPGPMGDPCNFPAAQQAQFVPDRVRAPCAPSHPRPMTTMSLDWHDLGAVVDHLRKLRGVDQVSLVAWAQGGPRAGGYAAQNPGKVNSLIVLAPAYTRGSGPEAPNPLQTGDGSMLASGRFLA